MCDVSAVYRVKLEYTEYCRLSTGSQMSAWSRMSTYSNMIVFQMSAHKYESQMSTGVFELLTFNCTMNILNDSCLYSVLGLGMENVYKYPRFINSHSVTHCWQILSRCTNQMQVTQIRDISVIK